MRHAIPQDFIKNLHETIAWCGPRVNLSSSQHCLRSAQLRPDYEFSSEPDYDVDVWANLPMINKVVDLRSQFLTPATALLTDSAIDLRGGWAPPAFLKAVNEATEAECVGMLMWADAPHRWDGPPTSFHTEQMYIGADNIARVAAWAPQK